MKDFEKAKIILESTTNGEDLARHHQMIVSAARRGELGDGTGARLVFDDLFESIMAHPGYSDLSSSQESQSG